MNVGEHVWLSGGIVDAQTATVPILTHALHYGTAVFEGIRVYNTPSGPAMFRGSDHLRRLVQSARLYHMPCPWDLDELKRAAAEVVRRNGLANCYVRPVMYRGTGTMNVSPLNASVEMLIVAWSWEPYLGEEGKKRGIRAKVSSWRRLSDDAFIATAKASGHYLNSVLAKIETERAGYDEGIMLDHRGMVSEATGENIFIVRDGMISTPRASGSILSGITRSSVITIAADQGLTVCERDVARAELLLADEVFVTGTAAELTPVREIDGQPIGTGQPGQVTIMLQDALEAAFHGRAERYADWNELVSTDPRSVLQDDAPTSAPNS